MLTFSAFCVIIDLLETFRNLAVRKEHYMKTLNNLCITCNYHKHLTDTGEEVLQIRHYDDCHYHDADAELPDISDIPIPKELKPLLDVSDCPRYLLVFKLFSDSTAEIIMIYDPEKSILYDENGKKAKGKHKRRFMKLLFNAWESC